MDTRILLRSQKNEILSLIKSFALNPAKFKWSETFSELYSDKLISRLNYLDSDYFFSFEMKGESHHAVFSPADNSYIGTNYSGTWQEQIISFTNWIRNIIKEKDEPDLWKNIPGNYDNNENMKTPTYTVEPSPFSPGPDQITSHLNELFDESTISSGYSLKQSDFRRYYGKA